MEVLVQHGWGFSPSIWTEWEKLFKNAKVHFADRGYFHSSYSPGFQNPQEPHMAVVHSFGLHLLEKKLFEEIDCLIIFNSFIKFSYPRNMLFKMQKALGTNPSKLLEEFYQNCFFPHKNPLQPSTSLHVDLLENDLEKLFNAELDLGSLKKIPHVLILHGSCDEIVPCEESIRLHQLLPNSLYFQIDGAGHALPFSHTKECWEIIQGFTHEKKFSFKKSLIKAFSKGTKNYHMMAKVQKKAASSLGERIPSLPDGPILEIGCGTGFLTEKILSSFPKRSMIISDLSSDMLEFCKHRMSFDPKLVSFEIKDGEKILEKDAFALIISAMTFQWFENLHKSLIHLHASLKKEGALLFSFLEEGSFNEWKMACKECKVPFTGHLLPNAKDVLFDLQSLDPYASIEIQEFTTHYDTPSEFFKQLKLIGASHTLSSKKLSIFETKRLLAHWSSNHKIEVTYRVGFACLHKR